MSRIHTAFLPSGLVITFRPVTIRHMIALQGLDRRALSAQSAWMAEVCAMPLDDILDLADSYAETFQGHWGVIPITAYIDDFKVQKDAKVYVKGLLKFAQGMREELPDDPDLTNIHDEIVGLIAATLYKLENLS